MRINDKGIELIKAFESLRLEPYKDAVGKPTIGWGHTSGVTMDMGSITEQEAEELLLEDLTYSENVIRRYVHVPLNVNQFSALVSFVFNVGEGAKNIKSGFVRLKDGSPSTMLIKLNIEDYNGASQEFGKWIKGDGRILTGLVRRREAERRLFTEPVK